MILLNQVAHPPHLQAVDPVDQVARPPHLHAVNPVNQVACLPHLQAVNPVDQVASLLLHEVMLQQSARVESRAHNRMSANTYFAWSETEKSIGKGGRNEVKWIRRIQKSESESLFC